MLELHKRYAESTENPVVMSNYHGAAAADRFSHADYVAAAREWQPRQISIRQIWSPTFRAPLGRRSGAVIATAKQLLERFERLLVHSLEADAARNTMGAGIAAREGRRQDALLMYGEDASAMGELQVLLTGPW